MRNMAVVFLFCIVIAVSWGAANERALLEELRTAKLNNKLISQTTVLIELGELKLGDKDYETALDYYTQAHKLALKRKDASDILYTTVQIANTYDSMGEFTNALKWYNDALLLPRDAANEKQVSHIHNNIGNLYLMIGSYAKSLEHYQKALDIKNKQQDKQGIANALMNMSVFYIRTGNYPKTLEYQFQALALRKANTDQTQVAATLSSISITYSHLKDYPKAFDYNQQALELYTKLNNPAKIASAYNNLGILYQFTGELENAKATYLKSYALKKDSEDLQSILSTLINLADICVKLKHLSEAAGYLNKANVLQKNTQYYELSRNLTKINSEYYEAIGNHKEALKYFKQYYTISDSLANEQKSKQLSELEVKYEVLEKERNIELLTKNNELSQKDLRKSAQLRNYLITILILILFIVIIFIRLYRRTLKLNKQLNASQESLNTLNLELERRVETEVAIRQQQEQKALRQSRLAILGELAAGIAHELNQPMQTLSLTLENIMLAIQDKQLSGEYLEQKMNYLFADISRMQDVIEHIRCFSRQSEDTGKSNFDLNQSIKNAVTMVQDRFMQKGVKIILKLEEGIPQVSGNQYKFEHVILNLLTNARDAIGERKESDPQLKGEIEITAEREGTQTKITVKDNGCGIPVENQDKVFDIFYTTKSLEKGTGLGLSISSGIIKGMNGALSIDSTLGIGTSITICIPQLDGKGAIDGFESINS